MAKKKCRDKYHSLRSKFKKRWNIQQLYQLILVGLRLVHALAAANVKVISYFSLIERTNPPPSECNLGNELGGIYHLFTFHTSSTSSSAVCVLNFDITNMRDFVK
jgi:hypothetical protein